MAEFDDLLDLEYEGVKLPCSDHPYEGGHDAAEHRAYLRAGAVFEPTGRAPYTGTCKCPLYNSPELERAYGQLFPLLSERIRGRFESTPIGRLVHPVLGALTVIVRSWSFSGTSDARNGCELSFQWAEHNASVAEVLDLTDASPERVQTQASIADAAVAAVAPSAPATSPTVTASLATVTNSTSRPTEVGGAFRDMLSAVDSVRARADLASSAASTATLELERLRGRIEQLRASVLAGDETVRVFELPRTMALWEVAAEVYGTVTTLAVAQLQTANASLLSSPLAIAAGTRLRIPPLVTP
jgi:hypothetical protein